jgi:probable rRNA maturation factor
MLEINNTYELAYPAQYQQAMTDTIQQIFKDNKVPLDSITLTLLTDEALLEINENFLQHDYYTDILTFYYSEENQPIEGELFLSIERIQDNADTLGVSFNEEFLRVVFHGCLHLCGFDDQSKEEKEVMRKEEDKYVTQCLEAKQ